MRQRHADLRVRVHHEAGAVEASRRRSAPDVRRAEVPHRDADDSAVARRGRRSLRLRLGLRRRWPVRSGDRRGGAGRRGGERGDDRRRAACLRAAPSPVAPARPAVQPPPRAGARSRRAPTRADGCAPRAARRSTLPAARCETTCCCSFSAPMHSRRLRGDVRPAALHVADDRARLVADAVDGVDAVEQIVEVRCTEQHLDRRIGVARRVEVDRLLRECACARLKFTRATPSSNRERFRSLSMRTSFTFAWFQRSIATDTWVSSELICEMMLCASACFEATGPLSAVAAEVTPKATTTTQSNAGMWPDSQTDARLPVRGKKAALGAPWERHKPEGNSLSGCLQGAEQAKNATNMSSERPHKLPGFRAFCGSLPPSCGWPDSRHACS